MEEIYENLKAIYADLKTDGDEAVINHLVVDRVDVCTYANTLPFRIRIINKVNDNGDYFYIKKPTLPVSMDWNWSTCFLLTPSLTLPMKIL